MGLVSFWSVESWNFYFVAFLESSFVWKSKVYYWGLNIIWDLKMKENKQKMIGIFFFLFHAS